MVSALFGTLTVLGIYLLTKELFAKNLEYGMWNMAEKEQNSKFKILNSELVALLSSFFLATSFWHINFSRIGFRAIMVPFFLVWSFFFLYRMLRALEEKAGSIKPELFSVIGGVLFGLGFHTYISYRLSPLLLISPFLLGWVQYKKGAAKKCTPCLLALFLFAALVAALPMGYYFLQHPEDFVGRAGQVSAFAAEYPLRIVSMNIIKTIGMFFWHGDYNWRHNLAGEPQLWWPVSILLLVGLIIALKRVLTNPKHEMLNPKQIPSTQIPNPKSFGTRVSSPYFFLLLWLLIMSVPAIISSEGIPHALRTIGMIPPTMILAAIGFVWIAQFINKWFRENIRKYPAQQNKLMRIRKEFLVLGTAILGITAFINTQNYFRVWAYSPETSNAFSEPYTALGTQLVSLPKELPKYVIVNADGVEVRGIPMPAQSIMFVVGEGIAARGIPTSRAITYILPSEIKNLSSAKAPFVVALLEEDPDLMKMLRTKISPYFISISDKRFLWVTLPEKKMGDL